MVPDYYKIFGISKNASKEEIKKKYRELAKKYHPDVNKSPDATSKMQEILEAYYILYDDEARNRYDNVYDRLFGTKSENRAKDKQKNERQNFDDTNTNQVNDPILEKWILNARKQAVDFIKNTYKDSKGITASGFKFFFYGLGLNILILIVVLLIIIIYRLLKN